MKKLFTLAIVTLLVLVSAMPVLADGIVTVEGQSSVSITPENVTLTAVLLNGLDQMTSGESETPWVVTDATGTGYGWHVTISTTEFVSGAHTIPIADSAFRMQLQASDISMLAGNTLPAPAGGFDSFTGLTSTEQTFVGATSDNGMGQYEILPHFQLDIPAETYAGTYSATMTVTAIVGE